MAEPKKETNTSSPVAGAVVALAALVVGSLWKFSPLHSSRPHLDRDTAPSVSRSIVPARMWQDPFDAVARFGDNLRTNTREATRSPLEIAPSLHSLGGAEKNSSNDTLALLIAMSAGSLADDAESRTRTRYAVVSALGAAYYEPPADGALDVGRIEDGRQTLLPYEWYVRTNDSSSRSTTTFPPAPQRILVVWFRDDPFDAQPLKTVGAIQRWIAHGSTMRLRWGVIGPRSSDSLQAMLGEDDAVALQPGTTVFSPWATAAIEAPIIRAFESKHRVEVVRTIMDDDTVAAALLGELASRGMAVKRDGVADVALVTEWDTFYGRALPKSFARALSLDSLPAGTSDPRSPVHLYTYLKGLDGSVPPQRTAARAKTDVPEITRKTDSLPLAPTREELERRREALERPEGDGQLDYLRRLGDEMKAKADALARSCGIIDRYLQRCRRLCAIGVLGSDIYDKLLVLQALRPKFPDVTFFTTDLDALMLHPAETPWTRNVVVASSYGLALADDLQKGVPPFRDSYQTSVFSATLAALESLGFAPERSAPPVLVPHRMGPPAPCAPRMFEVGRNGAVALTPGCESWGQPERRDLVALRSLAPLMPVATLIMGAASICAVLIGPMLPYFGFSRTRTRRKAWLLLATLVAVPLGLLGLALIDHGEPFMLREGVSIWPTECVRVWLVIIAVILIRRATRALKRSDEVIAFAFRWRSKARRGFGSWRARLAPMRRGEVHPTFQITRWGADPGRRAGTAKSLWKEYTKRNRTFARFARVIVLTFLFYLIGYTLVAIFGPALVPYRGWVAFRVDRILLFLLSVPLAVYLNFLTVDATRLSVGFIDQLSALPSPWDPQTLQAAKEYWGTGNEEATELLRMWLIEEQTCAVGPLVLYPAIVVGMLIAARSSMFDAWSMPPALLAIFLLFGVYVVGTAIILRLSAQRARQTSLARLRDQAWRLRGSRASEAESRLHTIEATIERIESLSRGAFAPIFQNPIVAAVLVPSGSFGLMSIVETLYAFQGK